MPEQKAKLVWSPVQLEAFRKSKLALKSAVLLHHPDPSAVLTLSMDASDFAVGAVLAQADHRPLSFFSKKLSSADEKKYSPFDRELLAVFLAIKHFRHVLEGRRFTVLTDHNSLCGALSSLAERSPRQTRHLSFIGEFTGSIVHIPGSLNVPMPCLGPFLQSPPSPLYRHCRALTWTSWRLPNISANKKWTVIQLERH